MSDVEKTSRFAVRLKELRLSRKMTQADLAKRMSVTQQAVGLWESGKTEPPSSAIPRLARFFNVPSDDLLGLDSGKFAKLEKRVERLEKWMEEMKGDVK